MIAFAMLLYTEIHIQEFQWNVVSYFLFWLFNTPIKILLELQIHFELLS